jgi:capsid protein
MSTKFDAVGDSPYLENWYSSYLSPAQELEEDDSLINLHRISHRMIKNNYIMAGAQQTYINSVVGGAINIGVEGKNGKIKELNDWLDEQFAFVDINREFSLEQMVEQMISSAFADGDVLICIDRDRKKKLCIKLIDGDRIQTPPNQKSNGLIVNGVEHNEDGSIKGFHVIKISTRTNVRIYSDLDYVFIPSHRLDLCVAKLFRAPLNLRPDMVRQYPVATPVFNLLRYKNQLLEAVLIGMRVSACFAGFVSTNNPSETQKSLTTSTRDGKKITKMTPATLTYMKPNETITFGNPNRPADNQDALLLRLDKYTAMLFRLPYAHLFMDLADVNLSALRGGMLEVERNINRWRRDLTSIISWITSFYIEEAYFANVIYTRTGITSRVKFPVFKALDAEKDARASKIAIQSKTDSPQNIAEGNGLDPEVLRQEIKDQQAFETELAAERLALIKELEEKYEIVFPETADAIDKQTKKRPGEVEGTDLDEDDALARRKEDGNGY